MKFEIELSEGQLEGIKNVLSISRMGFKPSSFPLPSSSEGLIAEVFYFENPRYSNNLLDLRKEIKVKRVEGE